LSDELEPLFVLEFVNVKILGEYLLPTRLKNLMVFPYPFVREAVELGFLVSIKNGSVATVEIANILEHGDEVVE